MKRIISRLQCGKVINDKAAISERIALISFLKCPQDTPGDFSANSCHFRNFSADSGESADFRFTFRKGPLISRATRLLGCAGSWNYGESSFKMWNLELFVASRFRFAIRLMWILIAIRNDHCFVIVSK